MSPPPKKTMKRIRCGCKEIKKKKKKKKMMKKKGEVGEEGIGNLAEDEGVGARAEEETDGVEERQKRTKRRRTRTRTMGKPLQNVYRF